MIGKGYEGTFQDAGNVLCLTEWQFMGTHAVNTQSHDT